MTDAIFFWFPQRIIINASESIDTVVLLYITALVLRTLETLVCVPCRGFLRIAKSPDPSAIAELWMGVIASGVAIWLAVGRIGPFVNRMFSVALIPRYYWIVFLMAVGVLQVTALVVGNLSLRKTVNAIAAMTWFALVGLFAIHGGLTLFHPFLVGVCGACVHSFLLLEREPIDRKPANAG